MAISVATLESEAKNNLRRFLEQKGFSQDKIEAEIERHKDIDSVYWITAQMIAANR